MGNPDGRVDWSKQRAEMFLQSKGLKHPRDVWETRDYLLEFMAIEIKAYEALLQQHIDLINRGTTYHLVPWCPKCGETTITPKTVDNGEIPEYGPLNCRDEDVE